MCKLNFIEPDPPGALYVTHIADDCIAIEWEKPEYEGHGPITEYIIEKRDMTSKTWQILARLPPNITDCELENMDPEKTYLIRVSARNNFGQSLATELLEPICIEDVKLGTVCHNFI